MNPFRCILLLTGAAWFVGSTAMAAPATGPLRVGTANPRYFTDSSGKAIYLTGAHAWNTLVDMGRNDPPEAFDFDAYLEFLERHHHNFIRLWAWDSVTWDTRANGRLGKDFVHKVAPLPWARTGPGHALDGKPKFDLAKFDPAYFERLRARVSAAGQRGIYVSVMLFEGWGLMHGNRGRTAPAGWAWRGHPFHPDNNINGIDAGKGGDGLSGDVHSLANPAVNAIQADYIRKVVDTVNDLDNVLYEVINEGGQQEWDWWVVKTIHRYERTKPKQHLVGITGHGAERLDSMLASPAEWNDSLQVPWTVTEPFCWNCGMDPSGRQLITIAQAAEYCGVSMAAIYQWMNRGVVDWVYTAGGKRRIYKDSLARFPEEDSPELIASRTLAGGPSEDQ